MLLTMETTIRDRGSRETSGMSGLSRVAHG